MREVTLLDMIATPRRAYSALSQHAEELFPWCVAFHPRCGPCMATLLRKQEVLRVIVRLTKSDAAAVNKRYFADGNNYKRCKGCNAVLEYPEDTPCEP